MIFIIKCTIYFLMYLLSIEEMTINIYFGEFYYFINNIQYSITLIFYYYLIKDLI